MSYCRERPQPQQNKNLKKDHVDIASQASRSETFLAQRVGTDRSRCLIRTFLGLMINEPLSEGQADTYR
jgi:hypothetical protein